MITASNLRYTTIDLDDEYSGGILTFVFDTPKGGMWTGARITKELMDVESEETIIAMLLPETLDRANAWYDEHKDDK
jgi:hypothetical protein